ncbi:GDP-fucose protein O-fucosyltransferase 1 [Folsomia candida]|uniref:GDP-fucose protein O-fucosyltransferase 1 n=1 Tax=Folsomia candida TaxID=158441 RepID=UPI000B8EFE23|nr:GDP-fucose protein O-fucosyltransferase 1 [Folsomia candida]
MGKLLFLSVLLFNGWIKLECLSQLNDDNYSGGEVKEAKSSNASDVDALGYIAFCPCMGRFGNQADQFLGALAFAKNVNRTLILPPWVEYILYEVGSIQVPFDTYFKVENLQTYHRVITMEKFMEKLASSIWPPSKRIAFCYMERGSGEKSCDATKGNPFGPFWANFKVDFIASEIFGPNLQYSVKFDSDGKNNWEKRYNGKEWPVLAFVGPPSGFPVDADNRHLQKYLEWQDGIQEKANKFISTLPMGPFVGIHLRNGADWSRVCELVGESTQLFSSPQCLGYRNEFGKLNHEMCYPSTPTIIKQVKRAVKKIKATSVFVASDRNHLLPELASALKKLGVTVTKLDYESPHVDLAILGKSNIFIGNCISSYSSFVKRARDVNGFPTDFFGFPPTIKAKNGLNHSDTDGFHDEL